MYGQWLCGYLYLAKSIYAVSTQALSYYSLCPMVMATNPPVDSLSHVFVLHKGLWRLLSHDILYIYAYLVDFDCTGKWISCVR